MHQFSAQMEIYSWILLMQCCTGTSIHSGGTNTCKSVTCPSQAPSHPQSSQWQTIQDTVFSRYCPRSGHSLSTKNSLKWNICSRPGQLGFAQRIILLTTIRDKVSAQAVDIAMGQPCRRGYQFCSSLFLSNTESPERYSSILQRTDHLLQWVKGREERKEDVKNKEE